MFVFLLLSRKKFNENQGGKWGKGKGEKQKGD